jgi:hypothetical protein
MGRSAKPKVRVFGGVGARLCPRSFGGSGHPRSGPHDKRGRETQARRVRGRSPKAQPEPHGEAGARRRGPQAQPIQGPTPTRVSFECPTTCAQPRESRGHGRSTLRSVVLITTKPDRGADVPQMYRVRRHRRIEAPTPVAVQTCQVKQPRTMSSIATHAPWLGLS